MKWYTLLIVIVVEFVYIILAGVIIHFIETPNEQYQAQIATKQFNDFRASKTCITTDDLLTLTKLLTDLQTSGLVPSATGDYGTSWDFQSSIYMTLQVIGTIGFGASPPKTDGGRVFLIFYAFIGIPIFIVAAFGLGDQLVRLTDYIRRKLFKAGISSSIKVYIFRTAILLVVGIIIFFVIPAAIFSAIEPELSYGLALSTISVIAVGYGDFLPGETKSTIFRSWYRLGVGIWAILSMLWFAGLYSSIRVIIIQYNSSPLEIPDTFNEKKKKAKTAKLKQSIDVSNPPQKQTEEKMRSLNITHIYHVPDYGQDSFQSSNISSGQVSTIVIN